MNNLKEIPYVIYTLLNDLSIFRSLNFNIKLNSYQIMYSTS